MDKKTGEAPRLDDERPIDRLLRWAETEFGLNQAQLADQLGVSRQTMTNWKSRGMAASWHGRAAALLHHSVDELVGRIPERGRDKYFDALMTFWANLSPAGRQDVLKHARYVKAVQNPLDDPTMPGLKRLTEDAPDAQNLPDDQH